MVKNRGKWLAIKLPICTMVLLEFGSLTQVQLMEKVRALQNMAYRLGVEEGKF